MVNSTIRIRRRYQDLTTRIVWEFEMQSILREKLLVLAARLSIVSSTYIRENYRFVQDYLTWLENAEQDIAGLRSSISILLQAEKTILISVLDGYMPANIKESSPRKRLRAIAAQSLDRVAREIQSKVENIDNSFVPIKEQICHAIAIISSKDPELHINLQPNQQGIDILWKKLGTTLETIPVFNYFCAKLSPTDRDYLLIDIIQNILSNKI